MIADDRTLVASLTDGVTGIDVSPYYRQLSTPGTGFVRFGGSAPGASNFPSDSVITWEVWLCLPTDSEQAQKWLDSNVGPIAQAYANQGVRINTVTPSELVLDDGSVINGVIIGVNLATSLF